MFYPQVSPKICIHFDGKTEFQIGFLQVVQAAIPTLTSRHHDNREDRDYNVTQATLEV